MVFALFVIVSKMYRYIDLPWVWVLAPVWIAVAGIAFIGSFIILLVIICS